MHCTVRYGIDSSLQLDLPDELLLADWGGPFGEPLDDLAQAVTAALQSPHEFPPLGRAAVPGDRVVLAIDEYLAQPAAILAPVVDTLRRSGVEPEMVTALCADPAVAAALRDELPTSLGVVVHDPDDATTMAYLATTAEGHPVYLNRAVCDADLVLPIGSIRDAAAGGYLGVNGGLYPAFSDAKTLARYRGASAARSSDARRRRARDEVCEVGWLLGALVTVQIVPGRGDAVLHVLAGAIDAVERRGLELYRQAWQFDVPNRAGLVVAAVEGDSRMQSWRSVGRALETACHAVVEGGAIVVCCDLTSGPGPGMQQIAQAADLDEALRAIRKLRPPDAVAAGQLADALVRAKVYLLSSLDEDVVEELGVSPIADAGDLRRLAARHDSCIVLTNAQCAVAAPRDA